MDPSATFGEGAINEIGRQVAQRLEGGESLEGVLRLAAFLGTKRAELLGRSPEATDVVFALSLFCWWPFKPDPPDPVRTALRARRANLASLAERERFAEIEASVNLDVLTLDAEQIIQLWEEGPGALFSAEENG